jgi:II/X family phage/plasmid replication protein
MIDTVKLRSPFLSEQAAAIVEQQLKRRMAVEIATGDVLYEVTSNELEGSWDNRIMIRLLREELVVERVERPVAARLRGSDRFLLVQEMRPCAPYLVVEGSPHKALVGHNITGGPAHFQAAACWFVDKIAELLWVTLPHGSEWLVERVDVTECYRLTFEAVQEFVRSMQAAEYPRRKASRYGSEALHFGGTTTAFKMYHKGPEFSKHDARRLASRLTASELHDLQALANGILRVEVSLKSKKLRADNQGEKPSVVQVTDAYLQAVHDREVSRVLREGQEDVQTVRTAIEVSRRLHAVHNPQLALSLYGIWSSLATLGETEVRKQMTRATFYRCRKQLIEAGCSWAGTDIVIRQTLIPLGFMLSRSSSFRDAQEDPAITAQLASYRQAA